jgi:hypothetical protein
LLPEAKIFTKYIEILSIVCGCAVGGAIRLQEGAPQQTQAGHGRASQGQALFVAFDNNAFKHCDSIAAFQSFIDGCIIHK